MDETGLLSARLMWIVLGAWAGIVLVHGLWRSRGEASQDPIRPPGPVDSR